METKQIEIAQRAFNLNKAIRHEGIIEQINLTKSKLEGFYKRKAALEQELSEIQPNLVKVNKKIADTKAVLLSLEKEESNHTKDDTQIDNQIAELEHELAQAEQRKARLQRIEELKQQESRLVTEHEQIEKALYLMEQFTRTKVKMLEEKINSRFQYARFKLFEILVNGGIEECCITTVDGVPYSSGLNNGMQIAVGMDIIKTLQKFYGSYCPIWIDQAESFYHLPKMNCQQIKLYVSEADKILRVANK